MPHMTLNEGSSKQKLGSIKDTPLDLHISGIYTMQSAHCGKFYFGQTIRKLFITFGGWQHIFGNSEHEVNIGDLRLIQEVRQYWKMIEYYEAIHQKPKIN